MRRVLLLALVLGCSSKVSEDSTASLADASDTSKDITKCCTLEAPSCHCPIVGTNPDGTCARLCDAAPIDWVVETDARGCPRWKTSSKSCLSSPPPPKCEAVATSCTDGCQAVHGKPYEEANRCVNMVRVAGCVPLDTGCTGAVSCRKRSDGTLFWFASGCPREDGSSWFPCSEEERDKVLAAPDCGDADTGPKPGPPDASVEAGTEAGDGGVDG